MKTAVLVVIISLIAARILYHEFTDPERRIETYTTFFAEQGGRFPEVFRAQIILESARLSSNVFKENNNLVGMRCARVRPTYCQDVNRTFAVYKHPFDSIRDYLLWQQEYLPRYERRKGIKVESTSQYIQFLCDVGYITEEEKIDYSNRLKQLIR